MSGPCCTRIDGALVMLGGPDREIVVNGQVILFEDHPHDGPLLLGKRGEIAADQKPRHSFWLAVEQWYKGGKRLAPNGRCLWRREPKEIVRSLSMSGRHKVVVGYEEFDDEPTEGALDSQGAK